MDRRRYLTLSAGALTALAGCSSEPDGSDDGTEPTAEPEDDPESDNDPTEGNSNTANTEDSGAENGPSYQFEGSGDGRTDSFEVVGALVTLSIEHAGDEQFQLKAVSSDEERAFVDHRGEFRGELAVPLDPGEWHLNITASGAWSIDVQQHQFTEADLQPLPIEGGGDGQHADWFGPIEFEGTTKISFEIDDESTARVWLADDTGQRVEWLHSATGPYEDVAETTQEGYGLVVVGGSSPNWSITISE